MSASPYRRGRLAEALGVLAAALLLVALTGCVTRPAAPPASQQPPAAAPTLPPRLGRRFDVVSSKSTLIVLAYRAGALAALGHNHVIGCHCLSGAVYLPRDPLRASLDLRFSVQQLTVDDPVLRAAERSPDFPSGVTQSDRQGTRHNMLSAALLNAADYPDITIKSQYVRAVADGKQGDVVAQLLVQVAGERRSVTVPVHYDIRADRIVATGEFVLKQTDLGLEPFSALGGALSVKDGMRIRLMLVAARRSGST